MNELLLLKKELAIIADPKKAKLLQSFFKTGKGEYGEGDVFLGIMVPQSRELAKKYSDLNIKELRELIKSKYHEERLIAIFILTSKYQATNHKKIVLHCYLKNMKYINNWDLIDLSAPKIVGDYLYNHNLPSDEHSLYLMLKDIDKQKADIFRSGGKSVGVSDILMTLATSGNIWKRRIAVLATFQFIKYNRFDESLKLAEILLTDKHDLMHKAVGWMLREMGKRDFKVENAFLKKYYKQMPRTMLRYAIERFPKKLRLSFLKK